MIVRPDVARDLVLFAVSCARKPVDKKYCQKIAHRTQSISDQAHN